MDQEGKLIDLITAAELVGVSPSTMRRAAKAKRLDAKRIGKVWVTTMRAARAWKERDEYHKPGPKPRKLGY